MRAAEVPAFLAELSALGVVVEPSGSGQLRVSVPRSVTSPAEVARRVRAAKPALLEYFARTGNAEAEADAAPVSSSPRRPLPGLAALDLALYGPDALPRRHTPPPVSAPEDRPHASPVRLCGNCSRWRPHSPGAEGGDCSAGWKAHGLTPYPPELGALPVTARGSRCWANDGSGWRKAVRA